MAVTISADQRHARPEGRGAPAMPFADRLDDVAHGEAALQVEPRRPADLGVSHAIGREVVDQFGGHPLEGLGRLEQGDREVEER